MALSRHFSTIRWVKVSERSGRRQSSHQCIKATAEVDSARETMANESHLPSCVSRRMEKLLNQRVRITHETRCTKPSHSTLSLSCSNTTTVYTSPIAKGFESGTTWPSYILGPKQDVRSSVNLKINIQAIPDYPRSDSPALHYSIQRLTSSQFHPSPTDGNTSD